MSVTHPTLSEQIKREHESSRISLFMLYRLVTVEFTVAVAVKVHVTHRLLCDRRALHKKPNVEFVRHTNTTVHLDTFP